MAKPIEERVEPAPLEIALLYKILKAERETAESLKSMMPEGVKDEVELTVTGTNPVPMQPRATKPPYVRATVFNDGPDPVYVFLNDVKIQSLRQAPLNQGDKLDIDTTAAKIQALFFACETSSEQASVRIHLLK